MSKQAQAPWVYYVENLKTILDGKSFVIGANKNLTVNYDVAGTLRGNWFLSGVSNTSDAETDPAYWPKQICFGLDEENPTNSVISVGGTVSIAGIYRVGVYDFQTITPASGKIQITATYASTTYYFLVELINATTLKVEVSLSPIAAFSGGESTYLR